MLPYQVLYGLLTLMKFLSRVVWSEGMYLAPHHFQTQSRYFEDSIAFLASNLWREPWGVLHIEMDAKAIENETVSLLHTSGIFSDGLSFDVPISDAPPPTRTLSSICLPSDSDLTLYLAVPTRKDGGYDTQIVDNGTRSRYSGVSHILRDETNGIDEQEVELARKNLCLLTERELSPSFCSFPVARLVRDSRGRFRYDDEFVPCSLRISASESLMLRLKRLLEIIAEKSATIARPVQVGNQLRTDALPIDVANYWFLHALHSAIPVLRYLLHTRHSHPADCFLELTRLAGALCTFGVDSDPRKLPDYNHANPGPAFNALYDHIQRHLEIIVPSNTVDLAFVPTSPYLYGAPITDQRCLRHARWILGIRSSIGESELMRLVPRLVKVCSARFVPELVKRALPGMTLTHLPVTPAAVRAVADMQYFAIDTAGPCWEHILHTQSVGIYIPGEIMEPEFTITVIMEQSF
jgi:type VI secretion system protein ImpJ